MQINIGSSTVGVFDSSKLIGGEYFDEPNAHLPEIDKIAWWTADKSSLDKAAVALFIFKQYDSYDELHSSPKA